MRVQMKYQKTRFGTLIEMLPGIYEIARVKLDDSEFTSIIPLSDLIIIK